MAGEYSLIDKSGNQWWHLHSVLYSLNGKNNIDFVKQWQIEITLLRDIDKVQGTTIKNSDAFSPTLGTLLYIDRKNLTYILILYYEIYKWRRVQLAKTIEELNRTSLYNKFEMIGIVDLVVRVSNNENTRRTDPVNSSATCRVCKNLKTTIDALVATADYAISLDKDRCVFEAEVLRCVLSNNPKLRVYIRNIMKKYKAINSITTTTTHCLLFKRLGSQVSSTGHLRYSIVESDPNVLRTRNLAEISTVEFERLVDKA